MKKIVSLLISFVIIFSIIEMPNLISSAANTSIEEFAEDMSELYAEEVANGKELEESVACRVVVKATSQPDTYKNAECVVGNNNLYVYQYSDMETAQKAIEYYNSLPYVKWAELDGVVESQALSYGNHMMQSDEAMEYIVNNNLPQEEVVVAVLDTGANFSSKKLNGRVEDSGINFSGTGTAGSAKADNNHGTFVSAVIVDNTPDNVRIVAYKVMDNNGNGTNLNISLGIDQAVADGVDIINLSLGSSKYSQAVYESVKRAYEAGVIVVAAAGNYGDDVSKYYPASFDEVYTVGSIDKYGYNSFFSNFGEEIDFVAPGHYIEFTESGTTTKTGTSFAAPFIAAAAAIVLSTDSNKSPDEVKQLLVDSCVSYNENLPYHDGFNAIYDYDLSETPSEYKSCFVYEIAEDQSLYYGNGMPQTVSAISIESTETAMPEFSVQSGTYHEAFDLILTAPDEYEIYYTLDETYPSKNSTLYTVPITISETTSVRAVAYAPNGSRSNSYACEYKIEYYADESDFSIKENGYINGYTGSLKELIVPDKINGITVTGIASHAFSKSEIIGIVLPDTATYVGVEAFINSSLKYFTASGLLTIDEGGLQCQDLVLFDAPKIESIEGNGLATTAIRSLKLDKLKNLGLGAFYGCKNLNYVCLPIIEHIPQSTFMECWQLRTVKFDSVKTIDSGSFSFCYWLKYIDAPKVVRIDKFTQGQYTTFYLCSNISEISFPNLEYIHPNGFETCDYLAKAELPSLETVTYNTFYRCMVLKEVKLPSVTKVEANAFEQTYSLSTISLPNCKIINNYAFRSSGIKSLYAPVLKSLGNYCFETYNDFYGTHIVDEDFEYLYAPQLETADDYAFAYTGVLTKLELPSLLDLGENAFLESSVSYFDAPNLKNASSLPTAKNSIAILSSEFSECSLDATGYDLTIYGTPTTYAQTYAEQYRLTFIAAPAIINDLPTEYFEGNLTFDVAGFNKTYQWYGTNNTSSTGTQISGAKNIKFVPSGHNYKYFYCVVSNNDNGYTGTVKTNLCQNILCSPSTSSNARITIATPSNRYLKYGESINLYANATGLPEGAKIKWRIVDGSGVTLDPSVSGKICTVTSKSNGNVIIEAYAVDKNGNTIVNENGNRICDREGISSEVSLWWIILYFIRQMFVITNTAVNLIS